MVLDTLSGIYGLVAPWYSSKGDAEQIRLEKNSYVDKIKDGDRFWENSCDKLILEGFLLKIAIKKEGKRYRWVCQEKCVSYFLGQRGYV